MSACGTSYETSGAPASSVTNEPTTPAETGDADAGNAVTRFDAGESPADAGTEASSGPSNFLALSDIPVTPQNAGPFVFGRSSDIAVLQGGEVVVTNGFRSLSSGVVHSYAAASRSTAGGPVHTYGEAVACDGPLATSGQAFYFAGSTFENGAMKSTIYRAKGGVVGQAAIANTSQKSPVLGLAIDPGTSGIFVMPMAAFDPYDASLVGELGATPLSPVRKVGGTFSGFGTYPVAMGLPRLLVSRGSDIVYCDMAQQAVVTIPKAGGAPTTLVSNIDCMGLATSAAGDLLVLNGGTAYCVTSLLYVSPGGATSVVASNLECISGVAIDGPYVYTSVRNPSLSKSSFGGTVLRIPIATPSGVQTLASAEDDPAALAVDNSSGALFFVSALGVRRLLLP